ncbi:acid protease [Amylocystis lapponica]|nr:acid protease [Amylocystis lapponica]
MNPLAIPFLFSFIALPSELAGAVRLGLQEKAPRDLRRRASNVVGTSSLTDSQDIGYYVNLTLSGQQFEVQIDTGSSDLYVVGNVPNSVNTGLHSGVTYAVGSVQGSILKADLDFLGYTVKDQAFINVAANGQNQTAGTGLIGLGPSAGSQVLSAVGNSTGAPALDRIFAQNTSTPNYITVLLGRADDPSDPIQGDMTIGEVLPGYSALTSQPKLDVTILQKSMAEGQHFQALLDSKGIIGPTGDSVDVSTEVSATSDKTQLTVVFDTGYTLPQVPGAVADAFYKSVPGSKLVDIAQFDGPIWQFPCKYEINVTFKFAGSNYPVHPLDTSMDLNGTDSDGNSLCYGGFQPMNAGASSSLYDMIFGMSFLRNVYMLVDYGDFIEGTSSTASPYIQLLSTSNDSATMHADFIKVRGNPASWTPSSTNTVVSETKSWVESHLKLVIGLSIGVGLILIGGILACCAAGSRKRRARRTPAGFMGFKSAYQPLHDPAPPEAHDLHLVNNGQRPAGTQQAYNNPWDSQY